MSLAERVIFFHTQPDGDIGVTIQKPDGLLHIPGLRFTARALAQYAVPEEHILGALRATELAYMVNQGQFGTTADERAWLSNCPFPMMEVNW